MVDIVPVDVSEESMGHNLLGIRRSRAQSQFRLTGEQFLENGNRVAGHMDRVQGLISKDSVIDFIFIFTAERRLLKKHLVDKHTKSPPINRAGVFLVQKNLCCG